MTTSSQAPYMLAMIVCDTIHRDLATGKCSLLGTFSTIGSINFPTKHRQMAVFLAITDGRGKTPLKIRLVSVDEDHILMEAEMELDFTDPRVVKECTITLKNIIFPEPGEYRLQLYAGDTHMLERRLLVVRIGGEKS